MNMGIYQIKNIETGDKYIGSSVDILRRFHHHKYYLRKGNHVNPHLQRAWNKYGGDKFEFAPLVYCKEKTSLKIYYLMGPR